MFDYTIGVVRIWDGQAYISNWCRVMGYKTWSELHLECFEKEMDEWEFEALWQARKDEFVQWCEDHNVLVGA